MSNKPEKGHMETLVEFNNLAAVTCIDNNKLQEAINILVQALQLIRTQFCHHHELGFLNAEEAVVVSCPSSSKYHAASPAMAARPQLTATSLFTPPPPPPPLHDSATTTVTNTHIHCCGGTDFLNPCPFTYSTALKYWQPFFAFQEPYCFLTSSGSTTTRTDSLTSKAEHHIAATIQLSVVVIFNCALCHERRAQSTMLSNTTRNALLAKAIALYGKVIDLYFESTNHSMLGEDSMANHNRSRRTGILGAQQHMIVMATVNNLVQLHHESSQVRIYYSQLMMVLFDDVQMTDYGSEEIQRQVDMQARVFLSNTVLSSTMELELSAAAA